MSKQSGVPKRSAAVDAAKTAAIFGTLLIHASAAGGFSWPTGAANWMASLFWNCLLRCAVPVFFLCSGALLLPPEKEVTISTVWRRYLPRILIALFFWAAAYAGWDLFLVKHRTGVVESAAIYQAAKDLLAFRHKSHLYYLHIILLVYALLPLTRLVAQKADRRLARYALGVWFVLGSILPTLRQFPPFSAMGGIPAQCVVNLTWGAVGYGLLGFYLTGEGRRHRPRVFAGIYLLGFALTFGATLAMSLSRGELYLGFLQGYAPGVCLQAVGIYGFCVSAFSGKPVWRGVETISKASFCIYLVHLFFLDFLGSHGLSASQYPPLWAVPCLAGGAFAFGFAVWLVLRRIPVVNRFLI